jgi:hypothetical protein
MDCESPGIYIVMNARNCEALIETLGECQYRLDYFASSLEGCDEELIVFLRSATETIKSAVAQLTSLKDSGKESGTDHMWGTFTIAPDSRHTRVHGLWGQGWSCMDCIETP